MDWLPSLLKHLSISRSGIVAVFITAAALYVGPKYIPEYVDAIPSPWSHLVQASLIFSGCLVIFWVLSSLFRSTSNALYSLLQLFRSNMLNDNEIGLLVALGQSPNIPLNIERIDFQSSEAPLSELELLQVLNCLTKKGLISVNPFASNLFSLTDRGKQKALEVIQNSKNKNMQ